MKLEKKSNLKSEKIWLLVPGVVLFAALSPEYIAPFLSVIATIYTIKKVGCRKKTFNEFSIGYAVLIYIFWMLIGIIWAHSFISAIASVGLWLLMFTGIWFCTEWIDSEDKMEKVFLAGTIAAAINGVLGILQASLRLSKSNLHELFNPFWRFLDVIVQKLVVYFPNFISSSMGAKEFYPFPTRSSGTFSNPLFYATFEVAMIPFVAYFFLNGKNFKQKLFGLLSLIVSFLGIAFSYSRGPYIASVVVFLMLSIYGGKKAAKVLATGFGSLVGIIIAFRNVILRFLTVYSTTDVSINTRKIIWAAVMEKIPQKLILGYGTGFDSVRSILHNEYGVKQPHAHNIILEIQMENGLIGVLLFIAICLIFTWNMFNVYKRGGKAREIAVTLFASFCGFCLCGMTDCIFYGLKPLQYMLIVLGLSQAAVKIYLKDKQIFKLKK